MDLLGSILGNMTKPPTLSEKEKEKRKKEKELAKKLEDKHKKATASFREKIEKKISEFLKENASETGRKKLTFPPMEKFQRSLIHDVAEVAGLVTHSFGEEDVDRHIVVWKKEFTPCEGELECLKKGIEDFDPVAYSKMKEEEQHRHEEAEQDRKMARKMEKDKNFIPIKGNYRQRYEHLIGSEFALEAAKKTELNKSYGMVSAEMKKDKRTVEDIQAEIRAKKQRKQEENEVEGSHCGHSQSENGI